MIGLPQDSQYVNVCTYMFHIGSWECSVTSLATVQVMMGGEWFESLFGNPDEVSEESIKKIALTELKEQLRITKQPTHAVSMIHKVRMRGCKFSAVRITHTM